MIINVSKFRGIFGTKNIGSVSGNAPISPTVRTSIPRAIANNVIAMMQTSGEGNNFPNFGIKGNLIVIGCKEKTIEQWDLWFDSEDEYSTSRDTEDFKQIQAIYNALKSYYLTLNK